MKLLIQIVVFSLCFVSCECQYEEPDPIIVVCDENNLGVSYLDEDICRTCTYWDQPSTEPFETDPTGGIGYSPEYKFDSAVFVGDCEDSICSAEACNVVVQ